MDAYVHLALNRTMHHLARKKQSLDDFTYNDAVIAGEIYSAMNATQFLGVSVIQENLLIINLNIEKFIGPVDV